MIAQPASIREPEIAALVAGTMSVLLRPVGRLAVLRPGDLLWVREPFYLPRAFAHLKPTSAVAAPGCEPVFAADHTPAWFDACRDQLGGRRFARELPKAWHRQHLRVTAIGQVALRELALGDIHAAGWDGRASFEVRWDQDAEFDKYRAAAALSGAANPQVLRIAFTRVAAPLPGYDTRSCAVTQRAQVAARQPAATPAPRMRRFTVPDRTPCPRCDIRRDRGCEHFPLASEARP